MHPDLKDEWLMWSLIDAGKATLQELETTWSFDDGMRMLSVMQINNRIDKIYRDRSAKE